MGVRLQVTTQYGDKLYKHNMRCDEVYAALGLDPKKHLPDAGVPPTEVNGVTVYVCSKSQMAALKAEWWEKNKDKARGHRSRSPMKRTFAICHCGRHIEVGHLHQHKCKSAKGEE